jgi:hypothetical protein
MKMTPRTVKPSATQKPTRLVEADYENKVQQSATLIKKWEKMLLAENAPKLKREDLPNMATLIENAHNWVKGEYEKMGKSLKESYVQTTGGVEPFLKILVPTTRRLYKAMSILDLVGTQAMNTPNGYIYAVRYRYAGDKEKTWLQPSGLDRAYDQDTSTSADVTHMSYVVVVPKNVGNADVDAVYANVTIGCLMVKSDTADAALSTQPTKIYGEIVYKEENADFIKVMINRYLNGTTPTDLPAVADSVYFTGATYLLLGEAGEEIHPITGGAVEADKAKVYQYFWNEIGYRFILKGFTGTYTTSTGELMGVYGAPAGTPEYKTMQMTLERISVITKERKLRIQYTDEMYQDLKAQFGMLVNEELMKMAELEIANEINAEILDRMISLSTDAGSWAYGAYVGVSQTNPATGGSGNLVTAYADGLNQKEKFQTLSTKLRNEANRIGLFTRKGAGNFAICTPNVLTALQDVDLIPAAATTGDNLVSGLSYSGMLGTIKVYCDTYNIFGQDYCLVGYKGNNNFDAGIIYCPYIALMVKKAVDPANFNDCYGFLTRYALVDNIFGGRFFFRTFTCDLSGSSISGLAGAGSEY